MFYRKKYYTQETNWNSAHAAAKDAGAGRRELDRMIGQHMKKTGTFPGKQFKVENNSEWRNLHFFVSFWL